MQAQITDHYDGDHTQCYCNNCARRTIGMDIAQYCVC